MLKDSTCLQLPLNEIDQILNVFKEIQDSQIYSKYRSYDMRILERVYIKKKSQMLGLLKSKNYIVFDIGSKKIASISFSLSNKGMTVKSIDHQISKGIKNKLLEIDQLSLTLKKHLQKVIKKSDNNLVFCNITDPNVISQKTKTSILSSNLGITKNN